MKVRYGVGRKLGNTLLTNPGVFMKKRQHSLPVYHMMLMVLLCIMFFIITAYHESSSTLSTLLKQSMERNVVFQAAEHALYIHNSLEDLKNAVDKIAMNTEIRSMKWSKQQPVLVAESNQMGVESIQIAKLDGSAQSTLGYQEDIKDREYFKNAINGLSSISEPFERPYDGKKVLMYTVPIYDSHMKVNGVLVANFELQFLDAIVKNKEIGSTSQCYIVNRSGDLLFSPATVQDNADIFKVLDQRFNKIGNLSSQRLFEESSGYFDNGTSEQFVVFRPIMDTEWFLVLLIDRNEMLRGLDNVNDRIRTILIVLSIFTVVFVIHGYRYYRQKRKLINLQEVTENNARLLMETKEIDSKRAEFFANISHELRTPLNVILSSLQLLNLQMKNKQSIEKETIRKHFGLIKRNSLRLNRLINNLIDTTRIHSNFYELHVSQCNIVQLVRDIVLSVEDYVAKKGITLNFFTGTQQKIISCDIDKVERILLNLLSNAIKFTDEGGRISIFLNDHESMVFLSVEDTGVGIPKDKIDHIFTRYQQVDKNFTKYYEGSGIGLSLVKSMVEMHGGTIRVESEPGKGSKFIIGLPVFQDVQNDGVDHQAFDRNQFNQRLQMEMAEIFSQDNIDNEA